MVFRRRKGAGVAVVRSDQVKHELGVVGARKWCQAVIGCHEQRNSGHFVTEPPWQTGSVGGTLPRGFVAEVESRLGEGSIASDCRCSLNFVATMEQDLKAWVRLPKVMQSPDQPQVVNVLRVQAACNSQSL